MRIYTQSIYKSYTRRKKRQAIRRSCDTGMRSAQSGDCVLPPAGARRCEANHRGIEGEPWSGTMCTCEEIERGTHAYRASKLEPVERWCTQDGKLGITIQDSPPESGRRTHLLYFTYSYCILSCVWKLATSLLVLRYYEHLYLFSMLILHVTSFLFCLYLLIISHFNYTFSGAHTEAHTTKKKCQKTRYSRI